jgi:hypothetical protein
MKCGIGLGQSGLIRNKASRPAVHLDSAGAGRRAALSEPRFTQPVLLHIRVLVIKRENMCASELNRNVAAVAEKRSGVGPRLRSTTSP